MDRKQVLTLVAAILTTLAETDGSPESTLYIFCDMDLNKWDTLRGIMVNAGWITVVNHYVTLTEDGRQTAQKIEAAIKS